MANRIITLEQYVAEAEEKFGPDKMDWKFICPSCGHVASVADYKAAGAPEGAVGFSCVGRWTGATKNIGEKPGPCNYAGGGLFGLNPVAIDGHGNYFEFAAA